MVFQSFNLFAHKTVLENVMLAPVKVRNWTRRRPGSAPTHCSSGSASTRRPTSTRPALRRTAAASLSRDPSRWTPSDALRRAHLGPRPRDGQRGPRRHGQPREGRHDDDRGHPRDGIRAQGRGPIIFMADGSIVEDTDPDTFFTAPESDRAKDFLGKILDTDGDGPHHETHTHPSAARARTRRRRHRGRPHRLRVWQQRATGRAGRRRRGAADHRHQVRPAGSGPARTRQDHDGVRRRGRQVHRELPGGTRERDHLARGAVGAAREPHQERWRSISSSSAPTRSPTTARR